MSIGRPSGGRQLNAVQMPPGPYWEVVDPVHAWGTQETVNSLVKAIKIVNERFDSCPKLSIGHISAQGGGHLQPHMSHQSGRDVDISYYYQDGAKWYKRATAENLDLDRTWTFVKALVTETDVDLILIDYSIQRLLRQHAEKIGDDAGWLDSVFKGGHGLRPIIRHATGHASHMHIRFFSPIAQETARRCLPILVEHKLVEGPTHFVIHRVRQGETLGRLAKRYGTTVRAIQQANGLRTTLIQAKKRYRIPQEGTAPAASKPVTVPPRRLPPKSGRP
jgi:penicillin-insensitive murein endopeptidase